MSANQFGDIQHFRFGGFYNDVGYVAFQADLPGTTVNGVGVMQFDKEPTQTHTSCPDLWKTYSYTTSTTNTGYNSYYSLSSLQGSWPTTDERPVTADELGYRVGGAMDGRIFYTAPTMQQDQHFTDPNHGANCHQVSIPLVPQISDYSWPVSTDPQFQEVTTTATTQCQD